MAKVSEDYPELFHYTGAAGVVGIITSGTLWATNAEFLNDQEEYRWFFTQRFPALLRKAIDRADEGIHDPMTRMKIAAQPGGDAAAKNAWFEGLQHLFAENIRDMEDPYVTSFCAASSPLMSAHGLLSQWRGYGREGGYAVVFDTKGLEELWPREGATLKGMSMFWGDVE